MNRMADDSDWMPFTLVGRLLILITLMIIIGGPFAYFYWVVDTLPSGRYFLAFFSIPFLVVGLVFFAVAEAVLKSLGFSILKNRSADSAQSAAPRVSQPTPDPPSKEKCPWCDELVVPNDDANCPVCRRPI
jgi:hypothetical protein